jgi:hypothetical protein
LLYFFKCNSTSFSTGSTSPPSECNRTETATCAAAGATLVIHTISVHRYIYLEYDPAVLDAVFARQKKILNNPALTEEENDQKAPFFVLLDDVISDQRLKYDRCVQMWQFVAKMAADNPNPHLQEHYGAFRGWTT